VYYTVRGIQTVDIYDIREYHLLLGDKNNDILIMFKKELLSFLDAYLHTYGWNNTIARICFKIFPLLWGRKEADGKIDTTSKALS